MLKYTVCVRLGAFLKILFQETKVLIAFTSNALNMRAKCQGPVQGNGQGRSTVNVLENCSTGLIEFN